MLEVTDAGWREDVLQADLPVLVMFWAPWNGGCKQYRPIFEGVAKRFTDRVCFATLNMDEQNEVPMSLNVRTLPSTALVDRGELVLLVPGVKSAGELEDLIAKHFAREPMAAAAADDEGEAETDAADNDAAETDAAETDAAVAAEPQPSENEKTMLEATDDTWQQEVLDSDVPVVVDFWAAWCPPCRQFTPIFEEFAAQQAGKIKCVKLDTDAQTKTAGGYNIRNIPAILFFKNGAEVGRELGLKSIPQLELLAERHFGAAAEAPSDEG